MNRLFADGRRRFLEGSIATLTDVLKVALVVAPYVYSDAHVFLSDLGTNTVSTPVVLASKSTTAGVFNAAAVTFPVVANGQTIIGLALFKDTGVPTTSPLLAWYDTKGDSTAISIVTNGGALTVQWSTLPTVVFQL